jgi:hypothetical protein
MEFKISREDLQNSWGVYVKFLANPATKTDVHVKVDLCTTNAV